ncbi:MAG: lipopolysaccharide heptosyltransferase II [Gammaproteobacteria bacterium]|nr:lipopolysaccharide heptosyltransferase II [Gammaproteobacteria bacterium]
MAESAGLSKTKLLIVAPAWVGDMVMAHSLVLTLLQNDPDIEIHMLAPPGTEPLARRMPGVARTVEFDLAHGELALAKRRRIGKGLAATGYATAIVLPNSFKSALTPWWAGIPKRTGWLGEARIGFLNDRRRLDGKRYPLMIERFMALGLPPGTPLEAPYPIPELTVDEQNAAGKMSELGLNVKIPVTVLCPGAEFGITKRWPAEHYAEVARHVVSLGHQVWLIGSPKDMKVCRAIENLVPNGLTNLAGKTSLLDAVDLLAQAERVVTNDSGLMHIASALGIRVVAIFGSTTPDFTPPLGREAQVVRNNLPCSPCFQRECPLGHMNCLNELTPRQVIEVL